VLNICGLSSLAEVKSLAVKTIQVVSKLLWIIHLG
jgi:hypothetical protein